MMLGKYVANHAQSKCFNHHLVPGARRAQRRAVCCAMCPMWVQRRDKPINSSAAGSRQKKMALWRPQTNNFDAGCVGELKVHCSLVSEHKDRCSLVWWVNARFTHSHTAACCAVCNAKQEQRDNAPQQQRP